MSTTFTRPLRVTHVVHALGVGGLEKQVLELGRRANRGVVVTDIVCTDFLGPLASQYDSDVKVSVVEARPGFDGRAALRLWRHFREFKTDIIHSHNERAHYLSAVAGHAAGVRVHINTRHGVHAPTTWRGNLRRRVMARLSSAIVAVSTAVRDATVEVDGIPASMLRVIYNGTDIAAPRLTRSDARRRLGLDEGDFVIGATGRLAPEKDYLSLVEAIARARATVPQIAAAILGDGPLADDLRNAVNAHGLDRVRFHGYCPDAVSLLSAFDAFVQPSLTEGISLSVIEAMTAGLPVIATSVGGNPEALADGAAGILVPARDSDALAAAIISLVHDANLRVRLTAAGRRRVEEHFSIEATARAYEALYFEQIRLCGLRV